MSLSTPVPSDVEATSLRDLVADCREVSSMLSRRVIDLTGRTATVPLARLPLARVPLARLPFSFGAMPVKITQDLLVTVDGLEDY